MERHFTPSENLAGRIAMVEVAPFMMTEAFAQPQSGLYALIQNRRLLLDFASLIPSNTDLQQHHDYWLRGGYPEPWLKNISPPTVREYFRIAHGTFIWRHIPPYEKNAAKRIAKHPKGYLRDSGLLHHFLHLYTQNDLLAHPQMGHSWEAMVIENLIRGLNATGVIFDYYHYRTTAGAEVDLVLEGEFGLLPIEIKYKQTVTLRDLKGIRSFIEEYQCPYGIVISNNDRLGLVDEKLINVPFKYV